MAISELPRNTGVLFDCDNTLLQIDSYCFEPIRVGVRSASGVEITDGQIRRLSGLPLEAVYSEIFEGIGSRVTQDDIGRLVLEHRKFQAEHSELAVLFPDTRPMLERLNRAGLTMGIISNRTDQSVRRTLAVNGIEDFFGVVLGSNNVANPKPDPEIVFKAANELGLDLGRSFVIGDSLSDIEAGRRAGARTVLVTNGQMSIYDIPQERRPNYIVLDRGTIPLLTIPYEYSQPVQLKNALVAG